MLSEVDVNINVRGSDRIASGNVVSYEMIVLKNSKAVNVE